MKRIFGFYEYSWSLCKNNHSKETSILCDIFYYKNVTDAYKTEQN